MEKLSARHFQEAAGTEEWRVLGDGACAYFPTKSLTEGGALIQAIIRLPGLETGRPDIDLRHDGVTIRLITYTADYYGLSTLDLEAARQISAAARGLGLMADTSHLQSFLVIPGAPDIAKVLPFWRAILGYEPRRDSPVEDLVDPLNRGVPFWFEKMDEPRSDGGGAIHVAIWLPYEQAKQRIDAALAAGGHMVRDQFAPAWWTLADAAGNEADISTIKGRD